jgi:N-acetylmuramoyl-L-alanine amidase
MPLLLGILAVSALLLALQAADYQQYNIKRLLYKAGVKTVVIDPGHGGHDSGCLGASSNEKNVALIVSLQLGKMIEENFPDVKVIYTRKTDVFVELHRRAQIANQAKADLFICIHCNAGPKTAYGAETFVMGLHKTNENLEVAKRENSVILQEDNYEMQYDGFDPNSPEANIIFSMFQNAYLEQSLYFAGRVQHEFRSHAHRHDRGVKQAGFLVLYKTAMPSVLIETGFLTNLDEEKFLNSKDGQEKVAESILRAFGSYKNWMEGKKGAAPNMVEKPKEEVIEPFKNQAQTNNYADLKSTTGNISDHSIFFSIQILSSNEKIALNSPRFKGTSEVWFYKVDALYKYVVGKIVSFDEALATQARLKEQGFKDAFIVAFENDVRISVDLARKKLKNY